MSTAIVLTRPLGAGSNPIGLTTTVINGQPMLTLVDITRANKNLSVAEQVCIYAENYLTDLDWLQVSNAVDADSGFIADFDGTVVGMTAHCENTGANNKDFHLFVNNVDKGPMGNISGGANAIANNQLLNIDFVQGDRLRVRAIGNTGPINDTVVKLTVKWREA